MSCDEDLSPGTTEYSESTHGQRKYASERPVDQGADVEEVLLESAWVLYGEVLLESAIFLDTLHAGTRARRCSHAKHNHDAQASCT